MNQEWCSEDFWILRCYSDEGEEQGFAEYIVSSEMKILTCNVMNSGSSLPQMVLRHVFLVKSGLSFHTETKIFKKSHMTENLRGIRLWLQRQEASMKAEHNFSKRLEQNFSSKAFSCSVPKWQGQLLSREVLESYGVLYSSE